MENPSIDPGTSRLFFTSGGESKHRSRYHSTFVSHLVENPNINLGTSRLFVITSDGEPGIDLGTFQHFVTSGGEPSTSRHSCHKYVVILMNMQTDAIMIICNIFLQEKWNMCMLNFSLVLVTPWIFCCSRNPLDFLLWLTRLATKKQCSFHTGCFAVKSVQKRCHSTHYTRRLIS